MLCEMNAEQDAIERKYDVLFQPLYDQVLQMLSSYLIIISALLLSPALQTLLLMVQMQQILPLCYQKALLVFVLATYLLQQIQREFLFSGTQQCKTTQKCTNLAD